MTNIHGLADDDTLWPERPPEPPVPPPTPPSPTPPSPTPPSPTPGCMCAVNGLGNTIDPFDPRDTVSAFYPRDTVSPFDPRDTVSPFDPRDTVSLFDPGDTIRFIDPGDTIDSIERGDIIELGNPIKSDAQTILWTQAILSTEKVLSSQDILSPQEILSSQEVVFLPAPEDEFSTPTIPDDFYLITPPREFWVYSQYSGGYNQNNIGQGNYSGNEEVPVWNPLLDVLVGSSSSFPRLFITGNATPDEIIRG